MCCLGKAISYTLPCPCAFCVCCAAWGADDVSACSLHLLYCGVWKRYASFSFLAAASYTLSLADESTRFPFYLLSAPAFEAAEAWMCRSSRTHCSSSHRRGRGVRISWWAVHPKSHPSSLPVSSRMSIESPSLPVLLELERFALQQSLKLLHPSLKLPLKLNSPADCSREPQQCQLHPLQNLQAMRKRREQAVKKPENVCKIYVSFLTLKVFQQFVHGMRNYFCH